MIEFNPEVLEVRMWKIVEEQIQALQQENEELKAQMKDRTCVVCGKFIASDICHIVPLGRTCWNEECFEKGKAQPQDPNQKGATRQ